MKVFVREVKRIFDDFLKIDRAVIQHEKFDGTFTQELVRLNLIRGDAAAILIVNSEKKTVILTRQFRYPAYANDPDEGWLLEIAAGTVIPGDDVRETAKRELLEEVGYEVADLVPIHSFYPSPGASSEVIHLFYAEVTEDLRKQTGGGLSEEGEDIRIIEIPIEEAFGLLDANEIHDGKTLIGLQWLKRKQMESHGK